MRQGLFLKKSNMMIWYDSKWYTNQHLFEYNRQ
jgi:hypothetical protein